MGIIFSRRYTFRTDDGQVTQRKYINLCLAGTNVEFKPRHVFCKYLSAFLASVRSLPLGIAVQSHFFTRYTPTPAVDRAPPH
jgi:hypothetical protein